MNLDERRKNLQRLRKHVLEKVSGETYLKDKNFISISNAFTLNIKNERS